MELNFDLNTFKIYYNSLLEHICSNNEFLKLCNNVSNIWKTTDQNFIRLMGSFFSKQPETVKQLIPSSKLYSEIVLFGEKNDDQELLKWVKSFNSCFLFSVAKAIKKNKDECSFDFNENLRICSDMFHKLKMKNEYLEKMVSDLQCELKLSQEKNSMLTSTLENLADEECENFRKRIRTKISSLNCDHTTTV